MGFAAHFGRLLGFFAPKALNLSVPGALLAFGIVLLMDDVPKPPSIARFLVLDSTQCSQLLDDGNTAPSPCTSLVRDSLRREMRRREFSVILGELDSLVVLRRPDSIQAVLLEAAATALTTSYARMVENNSVLAGTLLDERASVESRLREVYGSLARSGALVARERQDSLRKGHLVATSDSAWASYDAGGFAESLGKLTLDLLVIALFGLVIGAVLDPINKALFASGKRAKPILSDLKDRSPKLLEFAAGRPWEPKAPPDPPPLPPLDESARDAPVFDFIGRGWLAEERQNYLVTHYYRYAELLHSLIIPTLVMCVGIAHGIARYPGGAVAHVAFWSFVIVLFVFAYIRERKELEHEKQAANEEQQDSWGIKAIRPAKFVALFLLLVGASAWSDDPVVSFFVAVGIGVVAGYLLLSISRERHQIYRIRQWEACHGAWEAAQKVKQTDECLKQIKAVSDKVDALSKQVPPLVPASVLLNLDELCKALKPAAGGNDSSSGKP